MIIILIILILLLVLNNYSIENFSSSSNHVMNEYFDSVNVIAIPKRKKYMTKLMKKLNIKANIIDASLVKDIDYNELLMNNFISSDYYSSANKGRIACHYSQIKLIRKFLKSNDETIFIFEDDIEDGVKSNYKKVIRDSMENIPKDWDIVFFGRCWDSCSSAKKIHNHLYKVNNPKCRHAYGLSRKGAKKILKYSVPMVNNGDLMYAENIKNGNITAYAISPSIFYQNRDDFGSNLGNSTKNNIFNFRLFSKFPPECKIGTKINRKG